MRPIRGRANPWLFFLLAFLWSWLTWLPPIIFGWEWGEFRTLLFFALGFGPLLAALILVHRGYSEETPGEFWRRVYDFRRIPIIWLLAIIALPFGLNFLAVLFPAGATEGDSTALTIGSVIFIVLVFGLGASFAEELGWRGYALDPLQKTYSALVTGLIVGVFWGIWHLPLFFIQGSYHHEVGLASIEFWLFMLWTVIWGVLFVWIYNNTNRSILAAILLHAFINISSEIIAPDGNQIYWRIAILAVLTVVVVAIWGTRSLAGTVVAPHRVKSAA